MSASASVIRELEAAIQHGPLERRTQMLKRITSLFAERAAHLNEDHVGLFDDVLCRLAHGTDADARAELSKRLAPIANAPTELMRKLAADDDIAVAAPAIKQSPRLRDPDLVDLARTKSQAHLFAIAGRGGIGEAVTDVLVRRGDTGVICHLADNQTARLSGSGFSALVRRAESDDALAEKIGERDNVSREFSKAVHQRDYAPAQRTVFEMQQTGKFGEPELLAFAGQKKYEETVAALSLLCGVPVEVIDRLMSSDRPDPVLILCRAAGYGWPTVRAVVTAWGGARGTSTLDDAFNNYEKLSASTAQRVVRFWQVREHHDAA